MTRQLPMTGDLAQSGRIVTEWPERDAGKALRV